MDNIGILIIARAILALACVIGAAIVAKEGNEGWGWLIFAGIVLGGMSLGNSSE